MHKLHSSLASADFRLSVPELVYYFQVGFSVRINLSVEMPQVPQVYILAEDSNFYQWNFEVCLVLGDNIFYGEGLDVLIADAMKINNKATIFGYTVKDPQRYGVIGFNSEGES